jgi:hypothetical protein
MAANRIQEGKIEVSEKNAGAITAGKTYTFNAK